MTEELGQSSDRGPRIALGLTLLVILVMLAAGDKPWDDEVVESFASANPRIGDYVATWLWWALLAASVVIAGLLATTRAWIGRPPDGAPPAPRRPPRIAAALVALAILTSAALGWTRLGQSFWGDEAYSARFAIVGDYHLKRGEVKFGRAKLREVLWAYDKPNNHPFYSLFAHASYRAYDKLFCPQPRTAVEASVRLPAYLAGLAAIGLLGFVIWECGFPGAAVLAAGLLAIHPWHMRYATEARGYAFLFLLVPLLLWLLHRSIEHPSWRRWIAVGAADLAILWTFPGAVLFVLIPNLVALVALARRYGFDRRRPDPWIRMSISTGLAALVWFVMMAPNLPRLLDYLMPSDGASQSVGRLKWSFLRDVGTHLLVGASWGRPELAATRPELADLAATAPLSAALLIGISALAVVIGTIVLARAGRLGRLVVATGVVAPLLFFLLAKWNGTGLYIWYLSPALPLLVGIAAVGVEAPLRALGDAGWARAAFVTLSIALLAGYFASSMAERDALRARSLHPLREAVQVARGTVDPEDPAFLETEVIGANDREPYYDTLLTKVTTREGLETAIERARAEGRPVRVVYGRPPLFQKRQPDLYEALQDRERFEQLADLPGYEPRHHRVVLALRESGGLETP